MVESGVTKELNNVKIRGVMGMATFTDDMERVRKEFIYLRSVYHSLKDKYYTGDDFSYISMGMSNDYKIGLEEGSNILRLGTSIFGERSCKINNN